MLVLWSTGWFGSLTFDISRSARVCIFDLEVDPEECDVDGVGAGSRDVGSIGRVERVSWSNDDGVGGDAEGSEADIISPAQISVFTCKMDQRT